MMSLNVETLKRATGPLFFNPEAWANSHPSRRYCPEHPVATIHVPAGKNSDTADPHKSSMPLASWEQYISCTWHRHNARHIGALIYQDRVQTSADFRQMQNAM
jgi:hypothetical protein